MKLRLKSLLVLSLVVMALLMAGLWFLFAPRKASPRQSDSAKSGREQPARRPPRTDLPDSPRRAPSPPRKTGLKYVEGKGWIKEVDDPSAVPPPPKDALEDKTPDKGPAPLRPVTPAWKLKMKTRLLHDMERRIDRLQKALDAARKDGDGDTVHKFEILLKRTKMRTKSLRSDVALLKQQVTTSDTSQPREQPTQPQPDGRQEQ